MNKLMYKIKNPYAFDNAHVFVPEPGTRQIGCPQYLAGIYKAGCRTRRTRTPRITALLKLLDASGIPYSIVYGDEFVRISSI